MPEAQDLIDCASEPIHISGSVQDFGCLMVLGEDFKVRHISANAARFFGQAPEQILGRPLTDIVKASSCPELISLVTQPELPCKTTLHRVRYASMPTVLANVTVHHRGVLRVLEFEQCLSDGVLQTEANYLDEQQRLQSRLYQALSKLHDAPTLAALSNEAVAAIRDLTGYDRVMVYRFDSQWRGTVEAENKVAPMASYFGQSFPASDIPPQAREVFRHNASRMIADISAPSVALVPHQDPTTHQPFDMGQAQLRAPAPVHLEYLANMEVQATFTLTLLVAGNLWGLVACHHRYAKITDVAHREAAEIAAKAYSALIPARIHSDGHARRALLAGRLERLTAKLEMAHRAQDGLLEISATLAKLWAPASSEAALLMDGVWHRSTGAPNTATCEAIVACLRDRYGDEEMFHTHHVGQALEGLSLDPQVCSGLLAIRLVKEENAYVLWFVPEVKQAIDWAGRPQKRTEQGAHGVRMHPRQSFKLWREALRGHSLPWSDLELEVALQLRRALIEWDLGCKMRREQEARAAVEVEKQRFGLLAAASAFFSKPLGDGEALQGLAQFLTQQFCDWVVITGTDDEHSVHEASAHRDGSCRDALAAASTAGTLAQMLHERLKDVRDSVNIPLRLCDRGGLFEQLGLSSCVHLPLRVHERDLGHIYFVRGPKPAKFNSDDVGLATQLAERVAGVLDNDRSYRQSQSAIRSREYVLRIVSHDLRNPLGVVTLSAQSLRRRLKSTQEFSWQEPVNRIERSCTTMERLIGDVLSAANIESGSFKVRAVWLDGSAFMSEVCEALNPLCQASQIRLATKLPARACKIYGDKYRLLQAMGNLVSNALRFTPPMGTITLGVAHDGAQAVLTVQDTGEGISPAKMSRIFDQFWQGDQGTQSGAGLGLFIVRGIVQAHGGRIWADSTEGEGTTFTFTCPDPDHP